MGRVLAERTGQTFGQLTVEGKVFMSGRNYYQCRCACGNQIKVRPTDLQRGQTISCGCVRKARRAKHGGKKDALSEYKIWTMLRTQPTKYPAEWDDFVQFFCDVGERPTPRHRLTRRDKTEPHGPTNTYWRDAQDEQNLTAHDLGEDFVLDLRSLALAEAAARTRAGTT